MYQSSTGDEGVVFGSADIEGNHNRGPEKFANSDKYLKACCDEIHASTLQIHDYLKTSVTTSIRHTDGKPCPLSSPSSQNCILTLFCQVRLTFEYGLCDDSIVGIGKCLVLTMGVVLTYS